MNISNCNGTVSSSPHHKTFFYFMKYHPGCTVGPLAHNFNGAALRPNLALASFPYIPLLWHVLRPQCSNGDMLHNG